MMCSFSVVVTEGEYRGNICILADEHAFGYVDTSLDGQVPGSPIIDQTFHFSVDAFKV